MFVGKYNIDGEREREGEIMQLGLFLKLACGL